ncbi:MAG TPA: DUF1360 domain-containing protein [Streptosporangiaceae bacterium]
MPELTTLKERATNGWRRQEQRYAHGENFPLGGYVAAMSVFGGIVAAAAATARLTGVRLPDRISPWDTAVTAVATHKLSRLLAKAPVTSPLRAPFTAFEGTSGPAELAEDVPGSGARKTIGELVTCPFCLGMWVSTGFTAGYVFAPRATRLAATTLASLAGSDFLQFAYAYAEQKAG